MTLRRVRYITAPALALALLWALVGCVPERVSVAIAGGDGATWQVMDPLLERGELPNFRKLIDGWAWGTLRSELPIASPSIWTTVATGVHRDRHGISRGFMAGNRFISSRDRVVPALWTIASFNGLRSLVIGWSATFPA